jgi:hypothetical protein
MKTMKVSKRWPLVWLLTLVLVGTQFPIATNADARGDAAPLQATAPSGYGVFTYVPEKWQTAQTWNGVYRTLAYQKGYQVPYTASSPNIILDFGRQALADSGNWAIYTVPEQAKHSMTWVRNLTQDFIDGYNDNPNHPPAFVAIGTNNSNYAWLCNNNDPTQVSSLWNIAGYEWGKMVNSVIPRSKVTVKSANDIEAWNGTFPNNWQACGYGTLMWFDGYERQTSIANYNFGDNAADASAQWERYQIYQVIWGRPVAWALPQVYCSGSHWAQSWVTVRKSYSFSFLGVTSTNGEPGPAGCDNLSYTNSWTLLDNALKTPNSSIGYPGYPDSVYSNAVVWWRYP